jgi:membrane-associated phospholipid phosphatase
MNAVLFYGLIGFFTVMSTRRWSAQAFAVSAAVVIVALIGLSRIYLGLHYVSDVFGAIAAGAAWLVFCVTTVETYRRRNEHRASMVRQEL